MNTLMKFFHIDEAEGNKGRGKRKFGCDLQVFSLIMLPSFFVVFAFFGLKSIKLGTTNKPQDLSFANA